MTMLSQRTNLLIFRARCGFCESFVRFTPPIFRTEKGKTARAKASIRDQGSETRDQRPEIRDQRSGISLRFMQHGSEKESCSLFPRSLLSIFERWSASRSR